MQTSLQQSGGQSTGVNLRSILDTPLGRKVQRASSSIQIHTQWRVFTLALISSDLLMTGLAFRLAYFLRFELSLPIFKTDVAPALGYYRGLVFLLIPIWLSIFAILGLYDRRNLLGGTQEYSRVFNATTLGLFAVIAAGFLLPEFIIARGWLVMAWGLAFLLTAFGRFSIRRWVYYVRQQGFLLSKAVIIGANDEGLTLAEQLLKWKTSGLHLLGFIDECVPPGVPLYRNLHSLGTVNQLDDIVAQFGVQELILASSAFSSRERLTEIFRRYGASDKVRIYLSSGLYEIITTGLTVREFAFVPLVGVNQVRLTGVDRVFKAALDYSLGLLSILATLPAMALIALWIKLDSPGPIIHRRRVMGMNGHQFDAFKFRTMVVNGDEVLARYPDLQAKLALNHKLVEDPRITRVGKLLRKLSLDEIPQLFNVIRGEMSLVGPRMITEPEIEKYNRWDMNLLTVRPGITGLWQVSGRSDLTYERRVELDMYYVRNWSIWLDLQILLQTLPAVIKRRGAY